VENNALLKPSEALNRFTSTQSQQKNVYSITPVRFGFRIGDLGLLIPTAMISEVIVDTEIYHLPTTPNWFRGLINLRGSLVPVFDLKILFDIQTEAKAVPKLLVLNERTKAVGILTDTAPRSIVIEESLSQTPPLPKLLSQYSHKVYIKDQDIWVEFDFDGFFHAIGNQLQA